MTELTWGQWLRLWRQTRGWSQRELCSRADIDEAQLRRYERGRQYPAVRPLLRLAAALNLPLPVLAPLPLLDAAHRAGAAGQGRRYHWISHADRSPARPRPAGAGRRRDGAPAAPDQGCRQSDRPVCI